ncbi:MAG TPA: hypothetical protein VG367_15910 [Mucilaginibacter sp.]|jgi:hypothetical protein|nr:hypothetical protein [Mucilaginibacter sp.]
MESPKVERSLQIFDRKSEKLLAEYPVALELDTLIKIIKPMMGDPLLYRPYPLSQRETEKLLTQMNIDLMVETKSYHYFLGSYTVDDAKS